MTHGSLFSGSGGFDLAAKIAGIDTLWCAEIEPYPCKVLEKNFPNVPNLGDVTKINGAEIPAVDIMSGGSPCQDLSLAGSRAGLEGSRSSLFHEYIRIVKEMRDATGGIYPTFLIWENVPGAFSSNNGEDFRTVLEEIIWVCDTRSIPQPPKRWTNAGAILGDGYSLAWRVLDAQFWGVPQRRKRIYLVADFGGNRAPEILFKPESLSGYFSPSKEAGQGTARDAADGTGAAVYDARGNGAGDIAPTMVTDHNNRVTDYTAIALQGNGIDRADTAGCNGRGWHEEVCYTLNTIDRHAVCMATGQANAKITEGFSPTLNANAADGTGAAVYDARGNGAGDIAPTMVTDHNNRVTDYTAIALQGNGIDRVAYGFGREGKMAVNKNTQPSLTGRGPGNVCMATGQPNAEITEGFSPALNATHEQVILSTGYAVRRLTPLECCRLQGFPDDWAAEGSDSAIYKMWGNGIALPCAVYVFEGIKDYDR